MATEATVGTAAEERIPLGIAYACLGMFCVAGLDTLAKLLGEGYGVVQIMFFRNFFGLFVIAVLVWRDGGMRSLRTAQPLQHAIRGACALAAGLMFFTGLQFMPLAEAFAITFAGPVFIAALSVPLLGEKVGPRRWAAILVGFAAVLLILRPGSAAFQPAALLPLGAAFAYALVMIFSRRLSRGETTASILFWTAAICTVATAALLPFDWTTPTPRDWLLFFGLGVAGSLGMLFMVQAYRHAPAAAVAPFDYTILIWGLILGWLIWQELPDAGIWPGVGLLVACGLYIIHREARRGRAA